MVKYLGLDYLTLAINQKQQILNKALIAVPEHLEVVDIYTHQGNLEDNRYRSPWKRASCDETFLNEEKDKCLLFELPVSSCPYEETVEKFDSFPFDDDELGYFTLDAFVPSSNPNSPSITCEQSKESFLCEVELHHKIDLHNDLMKGIEEPLSENLFATVRQNIPTLKCLTKRLNQNQIKDPLTIDSANNFNDTCNLRLTCDVVEKSESKDCLSEDLFKVQVHDQMQLENPLSPFIVSRETESAEAVNCLEKLTTDDLGKEGIILPTCISNTDNHSGTLLEDNAEFEKDNSFLKLNNIDQDDDVFVSKALLDSPFVTPKLDLENEKLCLKSYMKMLPRISISNNVPLRILSAPEIETVEYKIWQKEKFCEDILSMRIAEIDIKFSLESHITLTFVINQLKLTRDSQICDTELSLNWDPVGDRICSIKKDVTKLEMMDYPPMEKQMSSDIFDVKVEKYKSVELHDWNDEILEANNPQIMSSEKPISVVNSPEKDFGFDQTDDFFVLRNCVKAPPRLTQVATSHKGKENHQSQDKPSVSYLKASNMSCRIETVHLGDELKNVVNSMDKKISYLMLSLKGTGDISQNQEPSCLTTDFTRFLLKQKEKQMIDMTDNGELSESFKRVVCLHALCGAKDILINCCLESAIAHLQAVEEKYHSSLTGIEDIRQMLFHLSSHYKQRKINHPKIVATLVEIEKCLKSRGGSENKFLIITRRCNSSFVKVLEEVFTNCSKIRMKIQENSQTDRIIENLEDNNCLVIAKSVITKDFPWYLFNLVIEYEYDEQSSVCKEFAMKNSAFVTFKMEVDGDVNSDDQDVAVDLNAACSSNQQLSIIGSSQLTACSNILSMLETRYNLVVIERNYDGFDKSFYFADIGVNERSCIVLHLMKDLLDDSLLELLLKKIVSLSLKYTRCWVLLYNFNISKKCYPFAGKFVTNLCKLQASLGNFVSKHEAFDTKVLTCCTAEATSSTIRNICDVELKSSQDTSSNEEFRDGNWLNECMTKEEKLLLCLPCVNSISAQIILKKTKLEELLTKSFESLIKDLNTIPKRILCMMYSLFHSDQGLNTRLPAANKSCQNIVSSEEIVEESDDHNNYIENKSLDDENKICKQSKGDSSDSKYFGNYERNLKQPTIGNRNRNKYGNTVVEKETPTFIQNHNFPENSLPYERKCRLKFGKSHDLNQEAMFQNEPLDLSYSNEDRDTQDTDDVLSLNNSQSSVILNEFEKAEIEGTVNRMARMEMVQAEEISLLRKHDFENIYSSRNGATFGDFRTNEKSNDGRTKFSCDTLQFEFNGLNDYNNEQGAKTNHRHPQIDPLRNKDVDFNRKISQKGQQIDYSASQLKPQKISESEIANQGMNKANTSLSDQVPEMDSIKNASENRSFTKNLTETTRNILRQAYQSPRFGVRPTRPFTHRISVGLAQPLRRETQKEATNDENYTRSHATQNREIMTERNTVDHGHQVDSIQRYECARKGRESDNFAPSRPPANTSRYDRSERPHEFEQNINYSFRHQRTPGDITGHETSSRQSFSAQEISQNFHQPKHFGNFHDKSPTNGQRKARHQTPDSMDFNGRYRSAGDMQGGGKSYHIRNDVAYIDQMHSQSRQRDNNDMYEQNFTKRSHNQWQEYDSPPMDLDYLEEFANPQNYSDQQRASKEYFDQTVDMTNRVFLTNDRCVPNKKRKLGYVRQPGSKGGQTKLIFK